MDVIPDVVPKAEEHAVETLMIANADGATVTAHPA
jgi:hypothetical protein